MKVKNLLRAGKLKSLKKTIRIIRIKEIIKSDDKRRMTNEKPLRIKKPSDI